MNGAEFFRSSIMETCKPEFLEKYRWAQGIVQNAIKAELSPAEFARRDPTSNMGAVLMDLHNSPFSVADKLDPKDPITVAAMLIGAISQRAYVYNDFWGENINKSFADLWKSTSLQNLAAKCYETVNEIVPEANGRFVSVDFQKMDEGFRRDIDSGVQEHIVLTGLNATGKSFLIGIFSDFLNRCNIHSKIVKMPRPDGPLSQVIGQALKGDLKLRPEAMQLAFLSDALDVEPEPDTLMVFDRHPRTEAYVYGPPSIAQTIFSAQELFKGVYWTFIIDRHPMACAMRVAERQEKGERSSRIFERKVESMTEQLVRFARLSALPGTHWINNDLSLEEKEKEEMALELSSRRFLGSIFRTGVLQRLLIRENRFKDRFQAESFLITKYFEMRFPNK